MLKNLRRIEIIKKVKRMKRIRVRRKTNKRNKKKLMAMIKKEDTKQKTKMKIDKLKEKMS